jgi:hypothetical protein
MNRTSAIVIGLLAGAAAGAMILSEMRAGAAAALLLFAAPAVVQIAVLGWGAVAGIAAVAASLLVIGFGGSPLGFLIAGAVLIVPAAWAGYLANLAQPSADGRSMEWYPLPRLFFHILLFVIGGFLLAGFVSGFSVERLTPMVAQFLKEMIAAEQGVGSLDEEQIQAMAALYAGAMPFVLPAFFLLAQVLVLSISSTIARASGRMPRPRDDIAATAGLPRAAVAMAAGGLAGMFILPGGLFEIAAAFAGASIAALGLIGLADLHYVSRGKPARGLLLAGVWLIILLFSIPLAFFAVTGAMRVWRGGPSSVGQGPGTPPSQST